MGSVDSTASTVTVKEASTLRNGKPYRLGLREANPVILRAVQIILVESAVLSLWYGMRL